MRGPKYRLSPNEVERLVKEERERRRKLRLLQVREQARVSAASVRNDVRREKGKLLQNMALEIKEQLEAEKEEKLGQLQQKYENTLHIIGEGHKEAHIHGDIENRAEKLQRQKEDELIAQARFRQALDLKKKLDSEKESETNRHIIARKAALEVEKERSSHIASLPPPPPDISVQVEKMKKKAILMMDMKAYATTHFHIPDYHVIKAGPEEQQMYDAKKSAEETDLKLKQDLQALKLSKHEQVERARIRGNEALEKEILKNDLGDMLKDLSLLQKKDRRRRQANVSDLPKQVFVPPEKCLEERQERQKEMEAQFDELYLQHCKVDVEDLPSMSLSEYLTTTDSVNSSGLDATPDISIPVSRINPALRDLTNVARQVEPPAQMKKPETVLRQLLNRIKEQRDNTKATDEARLDGETAAPSGKAVAPPQSGGRAVSAAESDVEAALLKPRQVEPSVDSQRSQVTDPQKPEKEILRKSAELEVRAPQMRDGEVLLSDPDKMAIRSNNKMIEDLLKRIQTIEAQKQILSKQFQAHAGFYNRLVSEDVIDLDQSDYSSLKEVDIEHKDDLAKTPLTGALGTEKWTPGNVFYAGESFPENKPGPDGMQRSSRTSENYSCSEHVQGRELYRTGALQELGRVDADLNKKFTARENRVTFNHMPSYQYYDIPQGRDSLQKLSELTLSQAGNSSLPTEGPNLSQKLLDYKEKVKEKQAVMDEETTRRVREYQQKLFETHEERKKLLSEVRADIGRRRQELKLDAPGVLKEDASKSSSTVFPSLYQAEEASKIEHKVWEPIKPFIAEPRPGLIASVPKDNLYSSWLYGSMQERPDIAQFDREAKNVETGVAVKRTDKIRRSLSFPDGDDSLSTTWNDTPASKCSQDLSNNSRIFSSEEDRGSPILSDKSKQSDNESFSAALVARAAESRKGFQQRQDEIQGQLLEIQRQKDAIQERYSAGQQALQQQQLALKSKLAQVAATTREMTSMPVVVSRMANEALLEPGLHRSWDALSAPESDLSAVDISGMHFTSSRPDSSGGRLSDTTSGRHSLGTPGNLSADSYLADISYQKIKSTEFRSLPTSSFVQKDAPQFSNIARPIPVLGSFQQPTWASLLKSSSDGTGHSKQPSLMQDFTQQTSWSGIRQADYAALPSLSTFEMYRAEQSAKFESIKDVMEGLPSLPSQTQASPSPGLSHHQPHELSTILEVDTPMSLPGKVSIQKQAGSTTNTMSSSLSSQISDARGIQAFRLDPDFKVDIFKESYTLPTRHAVSDSGVTFQLSKPQNVLQAVETAHTQGIMKELGDQLLVGSKLGAKRTLNFSDNLDTPQKFDTCDLNEVEDLSSMRMPPLVDSTPIRPVALHGVSALQSYSVSDFADTTPVTNDTLRSIDITGYSEYLRKEAANEAPEQSGQETSIDQWSRSYQSGQETSYDQGGQETENDRIGQETKDEGDSTLPEDDPGCNNLVVSEALLQAQEFDPMLVWRLQQQSKAVFGDSLDNTGTPTVVSGSISASVTAELEEVTISEQRSANADTSH